MKRIGIFIDHDIIVRHFIKSGVLSSLSDKYIVHYIFPENHKRVSTDVSKLGLENVDFVKVDSKRNSLIRSLYLVTALKNIRKRTGRDRGEITAFYRHVRGPFWFWIFWILSSRICFFWYARYKTHQIGENVALDQIIQKYQFDVIVHPTVLDGLFVTDLISLGRKHQIPTIYLMNSWDNPSGKAMLLGEPDRLLVWGEQTKKHAIRFLGMAEESVICAGAAQFQVYARSPRISRATYRESVETDTSTTLICYAGSSRGLNEMEHLKLLDDALSRSRVRCKIVYRPHPWKWINSHERFFDDYRFRNICLDPYSVESYGSSWNQENLQIDLCDYEHTNILLNSIDGLISPLSTILLEAAILGLPIAVYRPEVATEFRGAFSTGIHRIAFSEFYEIIQPVICENKTDLWSSILDLIEQSNDLHFRESLKKKTTFFVEPSTRDYSKILKNTIDGVMPT